MTELLDYAVTSVGFLLTVLLTTALSGILVEMGHGYGKIVVSHRFQPINKLFLVFLIEAVGLALAFTYLGSSIDQWLRVNLIWLPAITTEALVAFYMWFCWQFGFSVEEHWKPVVFPQAVSLLNWLVVEYLI